MKENIVKTIALENNHDLVIHDLSRKIGEDAWVVIMAARMEIPVNRDLFKTQSLTPREADDIVETLGDHIVYEYRIERNMIMDRDKEEVLENLVETFFANTGQYVAKPQFPEKLVLKEYRERIEKKRKEQRS
ncbi:hypothetical protein [Desulfospira joergensenii]|uniref:hypothetical protein n=1 Tax=Desulfospira joergensenii TaxID=53329 RepID=UPI0003B36BD1|nr:hypothetical protein [Desulfospira joergensenii]